MSIPFSGTRALALEPDEIALVVNSAEPAGKELAAFYAVQRHIPENRILELDNIPKTDEMTTREYEELVVPQVREFLKSGHLTTKVKCLVLFYGVPLRIGTRVNSAEEGKELIELRQTLVSLPEKVRPPVQAVEAIALKLDPTFVPNGSEGNLDDLRRRFVVAAQSISQQITTIPNGQTKDRITADFYAAATPLMGQGAAIKKIAFDLTAKGTTKPSDMEPVTTMSTEYNKTIAEAGRLEQMFYDGAARAKLRDLSLSSLGLLPYMQLMKDQVDYLDPAQSSASVDSEMLTCEWTVYPHKAWMMNPLFYQSRMQVHQPTLMIARLDAPTPELVKSMITTSVKTEQQGLTGGVVLDSLGVKAGEEKPEQKGYGMYDQYLRNLDQLLRGSTKLQVTLDEKPEVMPAGSVSDVALYCGWHSARNYIPSCKLNPGAVGYHIASYELISLRGPNETGWVHGLVTDGICGTLGSVAEPFLGAFPRPDDFFPLVLTGKLPMAEVYWKTVPWASWMMSYVGDPLYTPYLKNPQLQRSDLPFRLRILLDKPTTLKGT